MELAKVLKLTWSFKAPVSRTFINEFIPEMREAERVKLDVGNATFNNNHSYFRKIYPRNILIDSEKTMFITYSSLKNQPARVPNSF